jgi:hypothetical protein
MNSNLLGGGATPAFFGSISPSSAATVDVTFAGMAQRSLIGLTADERAELERLDRLSPVDHLGNCLWDFEGDPQTPDEKRWLVLYRRHVANSSTWPAAEGGPVASRFLFVRSNEARLAKAAHGLREAAALVRHRGSRGSGDTSQDWRVTSPHTQMRCEMLHIRWSDEGIACSQLS